MKHYQNSPFGGWGAKLRSLLLILPLVGGWGAACTSTDPAPSLPPITQEGKNTFGCKINGKNWVPGGDLGWGGQGPLFAEYSTMYESFNIAANSNYDGNKTSIIINASWNGKSSTIKEDYVSIFFADKGKMWQYNFIPFETNLTSVKITKLDTINKIVAGQFHFMIKTSATDTIKVTEGRFDVKYQ
jgi:hypothetical protein